MTYRSILLVSILLTLAYSCNKKSSESLTSSSIAIEELATMMAGHFDSSQQAQADSSYYDISLVMHPIWKQYKGAKWLYVEQAVSAMSDKPYRQRVYKLEQLADGRFSSAVYELATPSRYIGAWNNENTLMQLTQDSISPRQGCTVFLKKEGNCYKGSTDQDACKSSLRGASYATSIVEIRPDKITSWDQGWNQEDEQVWGATAGGYVFDRKK